MGERTGFSTNGTGTTGYPPGREESWTPISHHEIKSTRENIKKKFRLHQN